MWSYAWLAVAVLLGVVEVLTLTLAFGLLGGGGPRRRGRRRPGSAGRRPAPRLRRHRRHRPRGGPARSPSGTWRSRRSPVTAATPWSAARRWSPARSVRPAVWCTSPARTGRRGRTTRTWSSRRASASTSSRSTGPPPWCTRASHCPTPDREKRETDGAVDPDRHPGGAGRLRGGLRHPDRAAGAALQHRAVRPLPADPAARAQPDHPAGRPGQHQARRPRDRLLLAPQAGDHRGQPGGRRSTPSSTTRSPTRGRRPTGSTTTSRRSTSSPSPPCATSSGRWTSRAR